MEPGADRIAAVLPPSEFIRFGPDEIEQSIATRFERQARRVPERIAVKTPHDELTYAQLNLFGNRVAHAVLGAGTREASAVAILLEQGAALIGTIVGVLKTGRPYVGLDPAHEPGALRRTLVHCEAKILLTNRHHHALAIQLAGAGVAVIDMDSLAAGGAPGNPDIIRPPDDPAYIYYTSGTTGTPKGVADSQRNVLHNVMRYTNHLRIAETDRLTLLQSVAFSGAVSSLFCAILNGATCHPIDLREMGFEKLAAWLIEQRITIYHSVPSIFQRVVATGKNFPSLRVIRLEGDQMSRTHLELFQSRFGAGTTLVNGLGATETGISHQFPIRHDTVVPGSTVPVGYATADMEGLILDESGAVSPPGSVGEIAIRSRYLATGYWRRPDLTAAKFLPDPRGGTERIYRTGDLGRRSADGCVELLGRLDGALKLHGRWVDVAAVELVLSRIATVREAAVVLRENKSGEPQLVAYVVPQKNATPAPDELRRAFLAPAAGLPAPSHFILIAELPLDANGKVKRQSLPAPEWSRTDADAEFALPTNATEQVLARIWCQALKQDRVGIHDNFAALGGDSLRAIEIVLHAEQQLGVKVPASILLEAPTVAEMAGRLERPDAGRESLVAIQPLGTRRPFFLMHDYFGDPVGYGPLARLLGPDQPVYGLRMRGLNGHDPWPQSIEEMAAHYVAELRRVQRHGPYRLGGDCVGGVIAFEAAQQLRRAGEAVGLLALLDTRWDLRIHTRVRRHLNLLSKKAAAEKVRHLQELVGRILGRTRTRLFPPGSAGETFRPGGAGLSPKRVEDHLFLLEQSYQARHYPGAVVVLVVGPVRNQITGLKVRREDVRVVTLPLDGTADTHILHPQHVGALAGELRKRLLAADG